MSSHVCSPGGLVKVHYRLLSFRAYLIIACLGWLAIALTVPAVVSADSSTLVVIVDKNNPDQPGWVRLKDNTRQRLTARCQARLQAIGVRVWQWSTWQIKAVPKSKVRTCKRLRRIASNNNRQPIESDALYTLLVNEMNSMPEASAWVLHKSGHKQWVSARCRRKITEAGAPVALTDYATISRYPNGVWLDCQLMLQQLADVGETIEEPVTTTTTTSTTTTNTNTTSTGVTNTATPTNPIANPPAVTTTARSFGKNCLGVNDGFAQSWDGGQIATDALKKARGPLLSDYRTRAPMDADRWPVGNQKILFVIGEGEHGLETMNPWVLLPYEQGGDWANAPEYGTWQMEGATYKGRWQSDGVMGHEFDLGKGNNSLSVFAGYLPSGNRNRWHLVPKSVADHYARAMAAENYSYIFNTEKYAADPSFPLLHEDAVAKLRSFCRIRFMSGSNVNSLAFSGYDADRSLPSHPTWSTEGGDGIPYEWKTWIANRADIGVWHTDHVMTWEGLQSGDRYLHKQAAYYRDNLQGSLVREYGNEIWNFAWPFNVATEYVWKSAPFDDWAKSDAVNLDYGYGKRVYDTAGVWESVWASRRDDLDLTLGVHTHNAWGAAKRLVGPGGERWFDRIDSLAATFYFGSVFGSSDALYRDILARGQAAVIDDHSRGTDLWKQKISELVDQTGAYVSAFHMYEGASHQVFHNYDPASSDHRTVREHMTGYLNSEAYVTHLNKMFKWWLGHDQAGEAVWFSLFGVNNPRSPWGVYPNTRSRSMTYRGTNTFINQYLLRHGGT